MNGLFNLECRFGMNLLLLDNSIDSIVTDPPYGLSKHPNMTEVLSHWLNGDDYNATGGGFMGKKWDSFVPGPSFWKEAYRVLKPGGWCVVFAGSRTQDLMGLSLRLAGFEIMDVGMWIYGSGFPKSMDISKAIDLAFGVESKQWSGWGTALKPAYEPFILCRKSLDGTYANNVLKYGVGGLNIGGCRVGDEVRVNPPAGNKSGGNSLNMSASGMPDDANSTITTGRWPANIIHDGLSETWAKYFYCPKANKSDRNEGLETEYDATELTGRKLGSDGLNSPRSGAGRTSGCKNIHPTVKPTALMQYLCKLVTPVDGTVLDPFMGSGSTGKACKLENFDFIGFELESEYFEIAKARINNDVMN